MLKASKDFNFATFATSFTNFLLPWLGLIAQLPTITSSNLMDSMSLCMSVGSPALVAYSLTLTFLNRKWARDEFEPFKSSVREVLTRYPGLDQRLQAIEYVIGEAQQVPLRASQEQGWLSSLVVDRYNQDWWVRVADKLSYTRRKSNLILVFQIFVACIAWLFTIIAAFLNSLGDIDTALQIATSSVWVWMASPVDQLIYRNPKLIYCRFPLFVAWVW